MWKLSPVVLVLAMNAGCSDGCGNTIVTSKEAPDARHAAVLFQRNCGATTGFSTQISVLNAGKQPTGSGNAFNAGRFSTRASPEAVTMGSPALADRSGTGLSLF